MQTISVPKRTKFVEFQLDLDNDGRNEVAFELRFVERIHEENWGVVVILPNREIVGKLNTKPSEPWIIVDIELEGKKVSVEVIQDPEDDYKLITLRW